MKSRQTLWHGNFNYLLKNIYMYIVNFSVHQFECCGFNSPEDWKNATYFNSSSAVPISCCVDMTVNDCNKVINNSTMYTQVSHLVNQTSIKSNQIQVHVLITVVLLVFKRINFHGFLWKSQFHGHVNSWPMIPWNNWYIIILNYTPMNTVDS